MKRFEPLVDLLEKSDRRSGKEQFDMLSLICDTAAMEARPRHLIVYRTTNGEEPFAHWFSALRDYEAAARVARRLDRLETGNLGDCKPVGEGVLELRVNYGTGYRVYLAQDGDTIVVLLVGGDKKTQARDIHLARQYWRDYKERKP
jgi:putative addiction module killer protein